MKFATCVLAVCALAYAPLARSDESSAKGAEAQVVELVGGSYFFKPDHVTVKANVPVEFRLRKEPGITPHNFVIHAPEAGVQVNQPIDKTLHTIRVTFKKAGEYSFYCSKKLAFLKSHRDRGMVGTITVTP